jgi:hypothetical protein
MQSSSEVYTSLHFLGFAAADFDHGWSSPLIPPLAVGLLVLQEPEGYAVHTHFPRLGSETKAAHPSEFLLLDLSSFLCIASTGILCYSLLQTALVEIGGGMVVVRDGVSVFLAVIGVERGFGGVAEISPTERLDLEREREDLKLGKDQDSWRERMQGLEKGGVYRGHNASSHGGTLRMFAWIDGSEYLHL